MRVSMLGGAPGRASSPVCAGKKRWSVSDPSFFLVRILEAQTSLVSSSPITPSSPIVVVVVARVGSVLSVGLAIVVS